MLDNLIFAAFFILFLIFGWWICSSIFKSGKAIYSSCAIWFIFVVFVAWLKVNQG